jgi:hypothetical protein
VSWIFPTASFISAGPVRSADVSSLGGCVFIGPFKSSYVFGFSGTNCSVSSDSAFCHFRMGNFHLNESVGTQGTSSVNSFSLHCPTTTGAGCITVVQSIDGTFNALRNWGTGFSINHYYSLLFQYCLFDSTGPGNTLGFGQGTFTTDVFSCLAFLNNTVKSIASTNAGSWFGMICVYWDCQFRDCVFIGSTIDYLISLTIPTTDTGKRFSVRCFRCVFHQEQFSTTRNATLISEGCAVRADGAITSNIAECGRTAVPFAFSCKLQ